MIIPPSSILLVSLYFFAFTQIHSFTQTIDRENELISYSCRLMDVRNTYSVHSVRKKFF